MGSMLKTVISIGVLLVLFILAWKILKFAIAVLLPIALIIIAAYIVYKIFIRPVFGIRRLKMAIIIHNM